jgi:transposase
MKKKRGQPSLGWVKGLHCNTRLSPNHIVENCRHLWQIEKAFRISKTDLRIRPIYHYKRKRIKAHICISFVAYTIYKELERLLYEYKAGFSPQRAVELTHTMYQIEHRTSNSSYSEKIILRMNPEQRILYDIVRQ